MDIRKSKGRSLSSSQSQSQKDTHPLPLVAPSSLKRKLPSGEHHNGSHRRYMEDKRLKLEQQRSTWKTGGKEAFFSKDIIWINGETNLEPPFWQVDKVVSCILEHGGQYRDTLSKDVSIVICRNLNHEKIFQELNTKRRKTRWFVKPSWISDCILHNRRLPPQDYVIDELKPQVSALSKFVVARNPEIPESIKKQSELSGLKLKDKAKNGQAKIKVRWDNLLPFAAGVAESQWHECAVTYHGSVLWVGLNVKAAGLFVGASEEKARAKVRDKVFSCSDQQRVNAAKTFLECVSRVLKNVHFISSQEVVGTYEGDEDIEPDWIHLQLSSEFPASARITLSILEERSVAISETKSTISNHPFLHAAAACAPPLASLECKLAVERRYDCSYSSLHSLETTVVSMIHSLVEKLVAEGNGILTENKNPPVTLTWVVFWKHHSLDGFCERKSGSVSGNPFLVSPLSIARNLLLGLEFASVRDLRLEVQVHESPDQVVVVEDEKTIAPSLAGKETEKTKPHTVVELTSSEEEEEEEAEEFDKQKMASQQSSCAGIDWEVWEHLPPSIQQEILQDVNRQADADHQSSKNKMKKTSQGTLDHLRKQKVLKDAKLSSGYLRQMNAAKRAFSSLIQKPAMNPGQEPNAISSSSSSSSFSCSPEKGSIPGVEESMHDLGRATEDFIKQACELGMDKSDMMETLAELVCGLVKARRLDKVQYIMRLIQRRLYSDLDADDWNKLERPVQQCMQVAFDDANVQLAW